MKRLIVLASLFLQGGGQSVNVPIQNPSFEVTMDRVHDTPCGNTNSTWVIPGWTMQPLAGGGTGGAITWTCETVPDGKSVGFLDNAALSTDLGISAQKGVYVLKVFVANWFYAYQADYTISLLIGTKAVCSTSGYAIGDFTEIPLVCPMPDGIANGTASGFTPGNLGISVSNNAPPYWPLLFDKISLAFIPSN